MKKVFNSVCITVLLLILFTIIGLAHSGRTDGKGGHYDHSSGEYHYHHGYSAHNHYDIDGDGYVDCPYEFEDEYGLDSESGSSDLDLGTIIGAFLLVGGVAYVAYYVWKK